MSRAPIVRMLVVVAGAGVLGGLVLPLLVAGGNPVAAPLAADIGGAVPTRAPVPAASTDPTASGPLGLLRRAASAGRSATYSGTQYVNSWSAHGSASAVVDVTHRPGSGTTVAVHGPRGTSPGTATGGSGGASEGATPAPAPSSAVVNDGVADGTQDQTLATLVRNYVVTDAGTGHCAGRTVRIVEARPRVSSAVAGRFWLDERTGLLLRRELFDPRGRTVRAAAFVNVDIASNAGNQSRTDPGATPAPAPSASAMSTAQIATLRRQGWSIPRDLPGGLTLYDARTSTVGSDHRTTLHLSYSDGLFALSVFAERGRLDADAVSGWRRTTLAGTAAYTSVGLTSRTVWSGRDTVYTAVGDAPGNRVEQAVSGFPRQTGSDRVGARIHRGLDRMWSWVS